MTQKTVWDFFFSPVFTRNRDLCFFRKIQLECQKPIRKQPILSGKKCKMSLVLLPRWTDNLISVVFYHVFKGSVEVVNPDPWLGWQVHQQQCWRHGCSDRDSLPQQELGLWKRTEKERLGWTSKHLVGWCVCKVMFRPPLRGRGKVEEGGLSHPLRTQGCD